ncbi:MAG: PKD domain-containing protein, partial [Chitinophagales bacterium]
IEGENADFFDPSEGEGFYIVEYVYVDLIGCTFNDVDTVAVLGTVDVDFALPDSICVGELADIIYETAIGADTTLTWNLEEGTPSTVENSDSIEVAWDNAGVFDVELIISSNGCELGTLVQEITVLQSPILPELNCNDAGIGVGSIGWTSEDNHLYYYNAFVNGVSVNGGFLFTSMDNYTHPDNLENGDTLEIQVFAAIDGESFCGISDTVTLKCPINSCTDTPLNINGLAESYCLDDSDVVEIITEPAGGTLTISATSGLTGNTFNVADAGAGTHTFTYIWEDADGCPNETTVTTSVFENPEASFTINPSPICEDETATITYTGEAGMTNYEWDFGEGVASNTPLGNESYELTWNGSGVPNIELVVTLDGCNSAPAMDSLEIVAAPETPVLSCDNSVEGCITFSWDASEADSLYTFSFVVTPPGGLVSFGSMTIDETFYTLCDLVEGTTVRISNLAAIGMSPCSNSAVGQELTCTALSCSESLEINDLPATACIDGEVINFNFVAPNGASISGNGVTQNSSSTASFAPSIAGVGTHEITLTYTDASGDCPTFTETAEIEVVGLPIADFNIGGNNTEFCEGEEVTFTHASASTNDIYIWNFGVGASPATSSLKNPPVVTYSSPGTKTITLQVGNDGCSDDTSQEITIVSPLATPVVTCGQSSQTEITFDWTNITGNTGYDISYTIEANPAVSLNLATNTDSYTVNGLTPNQNVSITVIAVGPQPCGNSEAGSQNCIAQNCPVVNPTITNLDSDYCSDECGNAVTLTATPSGGVFTVNGSVVTEFDPCGLSGAYTIFYAYSENDGACTYQTSQQVIVNTTPTVTIGLTENELCVEGETLLSFEGTAGAAATYAWDFGTNANPATANTQGPHTVSWTSSGSKNITLEVTENNCVAENTTSAEVSEPLATPTITCTGSTQNSVGFAWDDVGGTGEYIYDVYVNGTLEESGQSTFDLTYSLGSLAPEDEVRIVLYAVGNNVCGNSATVEQTCDAENCPVLPTPTVICTGSTQNSVGFAWDDVGGTGEYIYDVYVNGTLEESGQSTFDLTYSLGDLEPEDEVRIVLYALGNNACETSLTVDQTCIAENCPVLSPTIEDIEATYCQDIGVIPLTAINTGGDGTGTGVFTLNGDVITEFDTNRPAGNYTINYVYTQGSCSGFDSHEVELYALPVASIAALTDACEGEMREVVFDGTAPVGASFTWDFGENVLSSTEVTTNSWEVIWSNGGSKTVQLWIDSNGCKDSTSVDLTIEVPLETPVVSCTDVTTNQVGFDWTAVAATYQVNVFVNSVPVFEDLAYVGESYLATGLAVEDAVSIEVIPLGNAPCGDGAVGTANCFAAECPDEDLNILMDNTSFCLDEEANLLEASIVGAIFTIGNDPTPLSSFNPAIAGVGTHMIYCNYTNPITNCPYVDSLEVNVFDTPLADFAIELQACPDETLTLEFTGLAPNTSVSGFNWSDFAGVDEVSNLGGGVYEVTWNSVGTKMIALEITTDDGCTSSFDQTIEVTNVELDMPTELSVPQGQTIDIEVEASSSTSNIVTYTWEDSATLSCNDCPNPTVSPTEGTLYILSVEDEDGCTETASVFVDVIVPEPMPEIAIPTAFSPNGDKINDVFRPVFNQLVVGMQMQIYNRWGEMVFESQDRNASWDGKYGKNRRRFSPVGTYVYKIMVEHEDGSSQLMQGNLTLIY